MAVLAKGDFHSVMYLPYFSPSSGWGKRNQNLTVDQDSRATFPKLTVDDGSTGNFPLSVIRQFNVDYQGALAC
jgi:hypothetical protein